MPPIVHQAVVFNHHQRENEYDESNDGIEMFDIGDTENGNIQPESTAADELDESVESDRVTWWTFTCLSSGIILHLLDVGSDIWLACDYLSKGKTLFFSLTIVFVWVPPIINMMISFRMDEQNKKYIDTEKSTPLKWKRKAWIKVPVFLLLSAPLFYCFSSIRYARKSRNYEKEEKKTLQRYYYNKMLYEDEEFAMLKIFDAFLEAAPQQTLQLTIMLSNSDFPSWIQIAGLCFSFLGMAWTMTSYHRCNRLAQDDKSNISHPGTFFQFLWHMCITVSRIIAISILASQLPIYTICACFVHWFFMTLWLIVEPLGITGFCGNLDRGAGEPLTLKEKIRSWLFAAVLGFVYIFTHLNPGENKTLSRHLFYFPLCGVENLAAVFIWVTISDQSVKNYWYFEVLISLTIVTFILGTIFMIIYYKYFHPSLNKKYSLSQGNGTSSNCGPEALSCLSVFVLCHFCESL